jgi:prolyl-tRNA editing enzyme YbaK/EbsC (Cys-tRNA(Pro) deacylase)
MSESTEEASLTSLLQRLGSGARAVWHADLCREIASGSDFAQAVGCAPEQVAKTLLLRAGRLSGKGETSADWRYAAVILAQPDRLDLNEMGVVLCARARLATSDELHRIMGVGAGSVSPFCTGNIPVYVDDLLLSLRTIFVNGGVPGVDIEVAPAKLIEATRACVGHYRL